MALQLKFRKYLAAPRCEISNHFLIELEKLIKLISIVINAS